MKSAKKTEKGQIIVVFVLGFIALLGMAALIVDGSQTYMNKRAAQMAADAGALAGAHEYCYGNTSNVASVASQYATVENFASGASVTLDGTENTVKVDVTIDQQSFLAQLIGRPSITIPASAAAGCLYPGAADHLMPVAFSCRAPVNGTGSISDDCQIKGLKWAELKPLIDGKDVNGNPVSNVTIEGVTYPAPLNFGKGGQIVSNRIYIIMDSDTSSKDHCKEAVSGGSLTCDLDGDGAIDLLGNGDRSWLDVGGSNLKKVIENFYAQNIPVHSWVPGEPGVVAAALKTVDEEITQKEKVIMVPVINALCPKGEAPLGATCQDLAHNGPTGLPLNPGEMDTVLSGNGNTYYHVIGFSAFYTTCVVFQGNDKCPGHDWAQGGGMKSNVKSVEGYFIEDYPVQYVFGSGGLDTGIKIVSLTE